ncbi:nucleotidyltransferase domain-containing protein [Clostridium sp.]|uniref:DNA polymerase beta superfamily protein n=1 Tax=Clostridium sp. TaxID=1506 RepID=UPI003216B4F4
MVNVNVQAIVQQHYSRLEELGYNIVGVFLYGSQNYELDYEGSDVDTKAIVVPTLNDIIINRQPISETIEMPDRGLCDVKDIRKMFECFKKQNINFIELLFTQYFVLNPIYEELYIPMFSQAEMVARYNTYASVNCMCGMAMEKRAALCHPYPSIKDKIEKYGYDPKQLHHIIRLREFIERYIAREEYKNILIPHEKEKLIEMKRDCKYTVEEAKKLADKICNEIKEIKDKYILENPLYIDNKVELLMSETLVKIITYSVYIEVCKSKVLKKSKPIRGIRSQMNIFDDYWGEIDE